MRGWYDWFRRAIWRGRRRFNASARIGYWKQGAILRGRRTGALAAVHVSVVCLYGLLEGLLVKVRQEVKVCDPARFWEDGVHTLRMEVPAGVTVPCGDLIVSDSL